MFGSLSRRAQEVIRREPPGTTGTTAPMVNIRIPVRKNDQVAPDPPRQGAVGSRPALLTVVTMFHDMGLSSEERFVANTVDFRHFATTPRGRLAVDSQRANLRVPPHVAYGSMFTGPSNVYGIS